MSDIGLKNRLQVLAGMIENDTLSTLYIPQSNTTIQLKYIPTWFEQLKYKICGFEYKLIREKAAVKDFTLSELVVAAK